LVLSGTLKEFILGDVFQLLAQQKITGKLVMNDGHSDGAVIFKNGLIVGAEKEDERFSSKLSNYLLDIKQQPFESVSGFINSFEDNLNGLTKDIIAKNIITAKEMLSFAESTIEDITCSLFQWKTGTYRFNSLRSVDELMICEISIPVENIVMEAMRRFDEWNRMADVIALDTIFIPIEKINKTKNPIPDPIKLTDQYLYQKIDGTTTVRELIQNTCITEYKVYETLNALYSAQKITVLSSELSNSVQAAIHKKKQDKAPPSLSTFLSILSTAGIILIFVLASKVLFKHILFFKATTNAYISNVEIPIKYAEQKVSLAKLFYKSQFGAETVSVDSLKKYFHLSSEDLYFSNLASKLQLKNTSFNK
jgi:hypothetical protein